MLHKRNAMTTTKGESDSAAGTSGTGHLVTARAGALASLLMRLSLTALLIAGVLTTLQPSTGASLWAQEMEAQQFATREALSIPLVIRTESGEREVRADLRMQLSVTGREVTLETFSLVTDSIRSARGETGELSFFLDEESAGVLQRNRVEFATILTGRYSLIDRVAPPLEHRGTDDGGIGQIETYATMLFLELEINPRGDAVSILNLNADVELSLTGIIHGFRIDQLMVPLVRLRFDLECPDKSLQCKARGVCIQPVFFQRSNGTQTGTTWAAQENALRSIWRKCCMFGDLIRNPVIVNPPSGVDIDQVTDSEAENKILPMSIPGGASKCLEVIVVGGFDPSDLYGGGRVNAVGRGADGRIVYSNACASGQGSCAANPNLVAHELGHLLGLCHPTDPYCPSASPAKGGGKGVNKATSGTVMVPTSGTGANSTNQSLLNCQNADNALMTNSQVDCCMSFP